MIARDQVERIAAGPHEIAWRGDTIVEPFAAGVLVRMGGDAVPVVIDAVRHRDDAWLRRVLIEVLGHIGDLRARPVLEEMLARSNGPDADRDHFADAVQALGRLASPESLPALRAQLANVPRERRIALLDAIRRCSDTTVVGEVLHLGYTDPDLRYEAIEVLRRHEPLQRALGLTDETWVLEDDLFLKAASEWHHEAVLGKPSPWRPGAPQFTEPFARAKRAAFAALEQHVARDQGFGPLRVYPIDPQLTEADARRDITLISGPEHAHGLGVELWRADQDPVVGFRLTFSYGATRSDSPDDRGVVRCQRMTLDGAAYAELIATGRTMLAARLTRWWNGPNDVFVGLSSSDFVVALGGIDVPESDLRRFCGSQNSADRARYAALEAAAARHHTFVAQRAVVTEHAVDDDVRRRFSSLFVAEQPHWNSNWWWVRERMVAIARDAGDATLLRPLATYLEPKFARGQASDLRTATAAIHALATLTGTDLRFTAAGAPRPIAEVAEAYRELLAK